MERQDIMNVSCNFEIDAGIADKIPLDVVSALAEAGYLLSTAEDNISAGYSNDAGIMRFWLTCWAACMPLGDMLSGLLLDKKLDNRHLKAFFWLKRHAVYKGSSWNPCDHEVSPPDFFADVERILRNLQRRGS